MISHLLDRELKIEKTFSFRSALSDQDIRKRRDEVVNRGWAEIGRRTARAALLILSDLALSLAAAVLVLAGAGVEISHLAGATGFHALLVALLAQPLAVAAFGGYRPGIRWVAAAPVVLGVLTAVLLGWADARLLSVDVSAWLLLGYGILAVVLLLCGRLASDALIARAYHRGLLTRRMLVVGARSDAERVAQVLRGTEWRDIELVGRLSAGHSRESDAVGSLVNLEHVLRQTRASGVIVATNLDFESLETLMHHCFQLGATVSMLPRTLHQLGGQLELRTARSGSLLRLRPTGLGLPQLAIKRAIDVAACGAGILLIWPLLALIAIAIRLDSRGPVFFRQQRAGVGGRPFWMYKFRTMVVNADELKAQLAHLNETGDPRLFKIKRDPRITRVGRFLRKSSLDELPQLFNVIKGDMSLVGPRPFFPNDLEAYEDHHFERLFVLPGITGLWQVSGRSDVVDFEEVVRLDSSYIRNWSVGLDFSILLRTLPAALGRGAY